MQIAEAVQHIGQSLREKGTSSNMLCAAWLQRAAVCANRSAAQIGLRVVDDHFLFVDWERALFSRRERLLEEYAVFRQQVNSAYRLPHALRRHYPNLAMIAVSEQEFSAEMIEYVRWTYLKPWYGGETGQVLLLDLANGKLHHHATPHFRQSGSLPLGQTSARCALQCAGRWL
jgi:hypothetical protein